MITADSHFKLTRFCIDEQMLYKKLTFCHFIYPDQHWIIHDELTPSQAIQSVLSNHLI